MKALIENKWKLTIVGAAFAVALTSPVFAFEQGDWLARIRAIEVLPTNHSGNVNPIPHSGVKAGNSFVPEVDISYMWTCNIGTELILATSRHTITGTKSLHGTKIGRSWVLPPTLLMQYHFCPCSDFQPYVGVGVNYTLFYNKHCSLADTHLQLKNSWGVAGQVGFDYVVDECWFVNVDVKFIQMDANTRLRGATEAHVNLDINPWIVGVGFGRVF